MNIDEIMEINNLAILKSFLKADFVLKRHRRIAVSVSGGIDNEDQATKDHLNYLEEKYHIKIERIRAVKPIPVCCHEYGIPFISKYASGMIERLQRHGFKWEDKPLEKLLKEYPNAQQAVKWWCNANKVGEGHKESMFNINHNKYLKEFMVAHPPDFKISARCCEWAKKRVSKKFINDNQIDLMVIGIRRAEGGIRAGIYKNCFTDNQGETADQYRPIFFYTDQDKQVYEEEFNVDHSACYSKYGFRRTGCVGCPFALELEENLQKTEMFEPKLLKACNAVFGKSYEYTRKYREFRAVMKAKETHQGQITIAEYLDGGEQDVTVNYV